ncbi:unnamed protein product [Clonostachys byssicola]|uniref:CBM1 domain-containing protein n=1 Tax=Clonostachys byssicola TaxID=160290 RepID=A0A9N9U3K0_9HYPO|nr:unnamed protein product [Clonostachys byssicola]
MLTTKTAVAILAFTATSVLAQVEPWYQCGGSGWTGETDCVTGYECVVQNEWYSNCLKSEETSSSADDECPDDEGDNNAGDEDECEDTTSVEATPSATAISQTSSKTKTTKSKTTKTKSSKTSSAGQATPTSVIVTSVRPTSAQATPSSIRSSVQATPTSSSSTPVATGTCGSASSDQLVGFGSGTTGGGSGDGTTVTSCDEFTTAVAAGGVIKVSGTLSGCDIVKLSSDTSIIGVGADAGFVGSGLRLSGITNVIIRNLSFKQSPEGKDLIDIEQSTYVWVDHCDFSNDGLTGDKDYYDGMLDIKRASDFITVSWNNFHDHWKASLIGHSDSNSGQDTGTLHATYHHNYWSNINSRTPSIRFGTLHLYSSCYEDVPTSGINSRMGAQVLVENTSFTNVKRAIVTNLDSDEDGYATSRDNIFNESDTEITQEGSFEPEYSYTADPASCICELLKSSAGVGIIG